MKSSTPWDIPLGSGKGIRGFGGHWGGGGYWRARGTPLVYKHAYLSVAVHIIILIVARVLACLLWISVLCGPITKMHTTPCAKQSFSFETVTPRACARATESSGQVAQECLTHRMPARVAISAEHVCFTRYSIPERCQ